MLCFIMAPIYFILFCLPYPPLLSVFVCCGGVFFILFFYEKKSHYVALTDLNFIIYSSPTHKDPPTPSCFPYAGIKCVHYHAHYVLSYFKGTFK